MFNLKEYIRSTIMRTGLDYKNAYGETLGPTKQYMIWEVDNLVEQAQVDQTANMARQELVHIVITQNAHLNTSREVAAQLAIISVILFVGLVVAIIF